MENKSLALATLHIPRSSFYYQSKKQNDDQVLKEKIETVLVGNPSYGSRRIALELKLNRKQVKRIMRKFDIRPRRARKHPKYVHNSDPAPASQNRLAAMLPLFSGHIWVTDFTYLKWHGRFVYLATVIDLYTREVVGCAIKTNHSAQLVTEALLNALNNKEPAQIIHSDQGSENRSKLFRSVLVQYLILQSMSHKGSPWQNGYQESFFGNFKNDIGDVNRFAALPELISEIYRSIYYYNNKRIHLALGCAPKTFAARAAACYPTLQEKLSV